MILLTNLLNAYGPYLGLLLVFLIIVAWVYRPSAKKRYEADGNIPFDGEGKKGKRP